MPFTRIKVNNTWKTLGTFRIKLNNNWTYTKTAWIRVGGIWKRIWPRFYTALSPNNITRVETGFDGTIFIGDTTAGGVAKYGPDNALITSLKFTASDIFTCRGVMGTDNSSNILVTGYTGSTAARAYIATLSSSGTLLWQKGVYWNGTYPQTFNQAGGLFTSNALYIGYQPRNASNTLVSIVCKYDTSGNELWCKVDNSAQGGIYCRPSIKDGNTYWSSFLAGSPQGSTIFKITETGTVLWYKIMRFSEASASYSTPQIDSSGNVYLVGTLNTSRACIVIKLDSNGTYQWGVRFNPVVTSDRYFTTMGSGIDSLGNYYFVAGAVAYNGATSMIISCVSPNGTVLWQRKGTVSSQIVVRNITLDEHESLHLSFLYDSAASKGCYQKLPSDGNFIGTYALSGSNIVWSAGDASISNITPTVSNGSLTATNMTYFNPTNMSTSSGSPSLSFTDF